MRFVAEDSRMILEVHVGARPTHVISRSLGIALLVGIACWSDRSAASDLARACDDLGASARAGSAQLHRHLSDDPNKVVFNAKDILGGTGVAVGGQSAFLTEAMIARMDTSPSRELRTGGAYVTSARKADVGSIAACDIVGVILPESVRDPAVASPRHEVPNISFRLLVPLDWNGLLKGKLIQFGGGLFNGEVGDPGSVLQNFNFWSGGVAPLGKGYALVTSDSGHRGKSSSLAFAKLPASGYTVAQQVAVKNYAGEHIKRVRDTTTAILQQLSLARPARTYFVGISTGGREALKAVSRFGADYNGAISVAPAWDVTAGTTTGERCNGLTVRSKGFRDLVKPTAPGATLDEKLDNFCQMVDLAWQPAVDLMAFGAAGGKLLIVQGTSDKIVPASKTDLYWNRFAALTPEWDEFARYYQIPGFDHGYGYVPDFDLIGVLDRWVDDHAQAPEVQQLGYRYALATVPGVLWEGLFHGIRLPWNVHAQERKTVCQYPSTSTLAVNAFNWRDAGECTKR